MKEQSHKNEMSAALRGDFARLRDRGVSVTLVPSEPEHAAAAAGQPAPDAVAPAEDAQEDAAEPEPEEPEEPPAAARPGWLSRLVGR